MADKEKYWDFKSRMRLTVCFKAGRFTLTQTSWTSPELRSRKWMSGYAAALAAKSDRRLFENRICAILALRESFRLSAGEPPFPLDNYLSWMSPVYFRFICSRINPEQINRALPGAISPSPSRCRRASAGTVTVTRFGVTSNGVTLTVEGAPTVTGLSPSSGPVNSTVVVSGTGFGGTQSSSAITFNGLPASVSAWVTRRSCPLPPFPF